MVRFRKLRNPTTRLTMSIFGFFVWEILVFLFYSSQSNWLYMLTIAGLGYLVFCMLFSETLVGDFETAIRIQYKKDHFNDWNVKQDKITEFEEEVAEQITKELKISNSEKEDKSLVIWTNYESLIISGPEPLALDTSGRFGGDFFGLKHKLFYATQMVKMVTEIDGKEKEVPVFYCPDISKFLEEGELINKASLIKQIAKLEEEKGLMVLPEEHITTKNFVELLKEALARLAEQKESLPIPESLQLSEKAKLKRYLTKPSTWLIILLSGIIGFVLGIWMG